jgi:phosphopantothenoylcysteine decarboxylase/phosphopantothenate--cysteine ligase
MASSTRKPPVSRPGGTLATSAAAPEPSANGPVPPAGARTVALCVTGSIAAFKAPEIARLLLASGVRVLPVLTRSGARFVGAPCLTGICGNVTRTDMWDLSFPGELHVQLATEADLVLVAPATADVLARMASGRADDLVTALVLCARGPVAVAPAMHPRMWAHAATQRSVRVLREEHHVMVIGPVVGPVANGEVGMGRMAEPADVVAAALATLGPLDLCGRHVVVTAGPTVEDIDPVRFLGNRSSGRMGFAIAQRAAARGARVTLVAGPCELGTPPGVRRLDVRAALAMRGALWQALGPDLGGADALVMAAAVADYRPAESHATKQKRGGDPIALELAPNPDLLAEIGAARAGARPVLVGFAVESDLGDGLAAYARDKLERKRVDLVVGNSVAEAFGGETNRATLVSRAGAEPLPSMTKLALADRILDRVRELLSRAGG